MKVNKTPASIYIERLIVEGTRKNYVVQFHDGINVIFGDSDTGKSGILNLIDYCLGSSQMNMYPELEITGKYAYLEVELNNTTYTIKRNLHQPADDVIVYPTSYELIDQFKPKLYASHYTSDDKAEFFSDFLLESLGIPKAKIRQAPSKSESKMVRISFRDIFKFCYLDQDNVGSATMLNQGDFVRAVKNREVFKYFLNLLDLELTELQTELSEKKNEQNKLSQKHDVISDFLKDLSIESLGQIDEKKEEMNEKIHLLSTEINRINEDMTLQTLGFQDLRGILQSHEQELNTKIEELNALENNLGRQIRLRNEYQIDIDKVSSISNLPEHFITEEKTACPLCHSEIEINRGNTLLSVNSHDTIKHELAILKAKKKGIEQYISESLEKRKRIENYVSAIKGKIFQITQELDNGTKSVVSPYIQSRDLLVSQKSKCLEEIQQIEKTTRLIKSKDAILAEINNLQTLINNLNERLVIALDKAPSPQEVLEKLSEALDSYLKGVGIANRSNAKINPSNFLPEIRQQTYQKVTSGGLRTILSIGYLIALQKFSSKNNSFLPTILMIDTVGKYLGITRNLDESERTQTVEADDRIEGVNDPVKYKNMYKEIEKLCAAFAKEGRRFQAILVDNNLPSDLISDLATKVVKKYRTLGTGGYEIGFIDDATTSAS